MICLNRSSKTFLTTSFFPLNALAFSAQRATSRRPPTGDRALSGTRRQISRPGKHSLTVHALCDSYVGIDKKASDGGLGPMSDGFQGSNPIEPIIAMASNL